MELTHNRFRRLEYVFCPHDGDELESITDSSGRRLPTCCRCGFVDYSNPKPCVVVLIVQQGRLLLARRAVEPAKGMWDIPGGFIEAGESVEEAVVREILEETGLEVKVTRYFGSLPDTYGVCVEPTLNLCFFAEPLSGILTPHSDVAELRWFLPPELPSTMAFAHQRQVLRRWSDTLRL